MSGRSQATVGLRVVCSFALRCCSVSAVVGDFKQHNLVWSLRRYLSVFVYLLFGRVSFFVFLQLTIIPAIDTSICFVPVLGGGMLIRKRSNQTFTPNHGCVINTADCCGRLIFRNTSRRRRLLCSEAQVKAPPVNKYMRRRVSSAFISYTCL